MKIFVPCEVSQAVTIEFRRKGHMAFSCDLKPCTGGYPKWHIQGNALDYLDEGWDMLISFPPCTHLAVCGNRTMAQKKADGRQQEAIYFFMQFVNAKIERKAIENPIGVMSTIFRKPDQIIHPYYFGDDYRKSTCLWLFNLPLLFHAKQNDLFAKQTHVIPTDYVYNSKRTKSGKSRYSKFGKLGSGKGDERSVTPPGLAKAMAEQWNFLT